MITKTASYILEKTAVARWKAEWSGLSNKAKGTLINKDIVKPWREEIAGINRGTDAIIKRLGGSAVKVKSGDTVKVIGMPFDGDKLLLQTGGYASIPSKFGGNYDTIVSPKAPSGYVKNILTRSAQEFKELPLDKLYKQTPSIKEILSTDALARRHEAYELLSSRKRLPNDVKMIRRYMYSAMSPEELTAVRKMLNIPWYKKLFVDKNTRTLNSSALDKVTRSAHIHPEVLSNELKLMNTSPNISILSNKFKNARMNTGELKALAQALTGKADIGDSAQDLINALYNTKLTNKDYSAITNGFQSVNGIKKRDMFGLVHGEEMLVPKIKSYKAIPAQETNTPGIFTRGRDLLRSKVNDIRNKIIKRSDASTK